MPQKETAFIKNKTKMTPGQFAENRPIDLIWKKPCD